MWITGETIDDYSAKHDRHLMTPYTWFPTDGLSSQVNAFNNSVIGLSLSKM